MSICSLNNILKFLHYIVAPICHGTNSKSPNPCSSDFDLNPKCIVTLPRSRDTVGDAIFSSIYLDEKNINPEKIFIVTSDYHCSRSREIFKFFHKPNLSISTSYFYKVNASKETIAKELDSLKKFKKMFLNVGQNDLLEAKKVLAERHPYYNGVVYPLMSF